MKPANPMRSLVMECSVGVAVCAAAYFFFVEPVCSNLAKVQAQLRQASAVPPPTPGAAITPEQARQIMDDVRARAAGVQLRSDAARDESALFASLMALAAAHNIRVDGLSPVGAPGETSKGRKQASDQPSGTPPPPPPPGVELPEPPPADSNVEFLMSTVCSYTDLVRFVDALQRTTGYTVVKSVKLEPAEVSMPDRVRATIGTVHLAFDTSRVIVTPASGSAK